MFRNLTFSCRYDLIILFVTDVFPLDFCKLGDHLILYLVFLASDFTSIRSIDAVNAIRISIRKWERKINT